MDTLEHAHVSQAQIILSTIPDMLLKGTNNSSLVRTCRALAPDAVIAATADSTDQMAHLLEAGANEVLLPYALIGDRLAEFVKETYGNYLMVSESIEQIRKQKFSSMGSS